MKRINFRMSSTSTSTATSSKVSIVGSKLKVGPMKRLYKYYTPTSINLAGGIPMDSLFPFEKINVHTFESNFELYRESNLKLNYQRGDGLPELRDWIHSHLSKLHQRNSISSCMTIGSTDALSKIFMLLSGDSVLFDQFAYGSAVGTCKVLGRKPIGVKTDNFGMVPEELKIQVLHARELGLNPDIVYLVPVAQNPTGLSMSIERKKEIYEVCQELDLIIVEDDAYYYLHFEDSNNISGHEPSLPGLDNLPKSIYSLDFNDGRVIRIDSLSKFIAPGMRLGWIAGPSDFISKYQLLQEITSQFPSGVSQSLYNGLLQNWGDSGLSKHLKFVQLHYLKQRNIMINELKKTKLKYITPTGGMFVWVEVINIKKKNDLNFTSEDLFKLLAENANVITVPGTDFYVPSITDETSCGSHQVPLPLYLRLTYAACSEKEIIDGIQRLQTVLEDL